MRYLFGFLCVCALGVVPLPRNASAQAAEHSEATEQAVDEEPSPEPAGEEGSPSLEYADPGSNPPNIKWGLDWSLHEDMDPAVRRARIGLITSAAVLAVGGALFGISYIDIGFTPRRWVDPVRITGVTLMAGGAAGMIATGALLASASESCANRRKRDYGRRTPSAMGPRTIATRVLRGGRMRYLFGFLCVCALGVMPLGWVQ